jgi:hypothetical protein
MPAPPCGRREVRHRDRRAGLIGGGGSGEHEDPGADDPADAEQRQVPGGQATPKRAFSTLDVGDQPFD